MTFNNVYFIIEKYIHLYGLFTILKIHSQWVKFYERFKTALTFLLLVNTISYLPYDILITDIHVF